MKTDPSSNLVANAGSATRGGRTWLRAAGVALLALVCVVTAFFIGLRAESAAPTGTPTASTDSASRETAAPPPQSTEPSSYEVPARPLSSASPPPTAGALSWPLWEFQLRQPIPPRNPSLTPPTWRLVGATYNAGKWAVIVLRQGQTQPEYFSVGEELPGGYRIESINDQDVTLSQGKRLMVLSYIGTR